MLPARWQGMGLASSWTPGCCCITPDGDPKWTMAGKLAIASDADVPESLRFPGGDPISFAIVQLLGAPNLPGSNQTLVLLLFTLKFGGTCCNYQQTSVSKNYAKLKMLWPQFSSRNTSDFSVGSRIKKERKKRLLLFL